MKKLLLVAFCIFGTLTLSAVFLMPVSERYSRTYSIEGDAQSTFRTVFSQFTDGLEAKCKIPEADKAIFCVYNGVNVKIDERRGENILNLRLTFTYSHLRFFDFDHRRKAQVFEQQFLIFLDNRFKIVR